MPGMNMFPGGTTLQIPLDAPAGFTAKAGNAQVTLTWTDPKDKYATPEGETAQDPDQLVSVWDHTVLVRKTGSQPAGPNDGTVVVSSSVRNQYQSTPYTDTGLTNDTTYYYAVFAYNKDGVASAGAFVNATPIAGTPLAQLAEGTLIKILENGSPVEFYLAKHSYEPDLNGAGRELLVRKDVTNSVVWSSASNNDYSESNLDSWLNTSYAGRFQENTIALIATSIFVYYKPNTGVVNATPLTRSFFCLSLAELGFPGGGGRVPSGNPLPISDTLQNVSSYWTRSVNSGSGWDILAYYAGINYSPANVGESHPTRPCFTLPNTALVDADLNLIES